MDPLELSGRMEALASVDQETVALTFALAEIDSDVWGDRALASLGRGRFDRLRDLPVEDLTEVDRSAAIEWILRHRGRFLTDLLALGVQYSAIASRWPVSSW